VELRVKCWIELAFGMTIDMSGKMFGKQSKCMKMFPYELV